MQAAHRAGLHLKLYRFSPDDYLELSAVFNGPHPETGEELVVEDEMPEGFPPTDLPPQPAVFAPDYAPEEIGEIAAPPAQGTPDSARSRPAWSPSRSAGAGLEPRRTAGRAQRGARPAVRLVSCGGVRLYLEILRTPTVARLFGASLLARLPMGINGLAIVLLVQAETGSFGAAGAASGALALGTGLGAPLTARLIDTRGPRALLSLAAGCSAGLIAVIVLARDARADARARRRRVRRRRGVPAHPVGAARAVPASVRPQAPGSCRARSRWTPC